MKAHLEVRSSLGDQRDAWDALVAAGTPANSGLRSWWLDALQDPNLRYVLVLEGSRLLGGMVFDVRTTQRFAVPVVRLSGRGYFGPLHGEQLAVPGQEDTVAAGLAGWLVSSRNGIVDLDGVLEDSHLRRILPADHRVSATSVAPYVRLPADFDTYLSQRSRNFRSNLRRNQRRLTDAGFHYRQLHADECDVGLNELQRLHDLRHGEDSEFIPRYERFRRIARAGVRAGELRFHVIAREDQIIAIDAVFEVGPYADYFQGGRDTTDPDLQGAGSVLLAAIIEDGCARGLCELDLEYPSDTYKLRFTDTTRTIQRLHATWGWAPVWVPRARSLLAAVRNPGPLLRDHRRTLRHPREALRRAASGSQGGGSAPGEADPSHGADVADEHSGDASVVRSSSGSAA